VTRRGIVSSPNAAELVEVEAQLRAVARSQGGPRAAYYRQLVGAETFWTGGHVAHLPSVEAMDEPGECMRVALAVADTHGFQVVNGWAVAVEHGPVWHCWNRIVETGELADAEQARRTAVAYVGRVLNPFEVEELRQLASAPTAGELLEVAGDRLAGFGRVLSGLLG